MQYTHGAERALRFSTHSSPILELPWGRMASSNFYRGRLQSLIWLWRKPVHGGSQLARDSAEVYDRHSSPPESKWPARIQNKNVQLAGGSALHISYSEINHDLGFILASAVAKTKLQRKLKRWWTRAVRMCSHHLPIQPQLYAVVIVPYTLWRTLHYLCALLHTESIQCC